MTISTFVKWSCGHAVGGCGLLRGGGSAGQAGATTLTLVNPPTQSATPETVTFTATGH